MSAARNSRVCFFWGAGVLKAVSLNVWGGVNGQNKIHFSQKVITKKVIFEKLHGIGPTKVTPFHK